MNLFSFLFVFTFLTGVANAVDVPSFNLVHQVDPRFVQVTIENFAPRVVETTDPVDGKSIPVKRLYLGKAVRLILSTQPNPMHTVAFEAPVTLLVAKANVTSLEELTAKERETVENELRTNAIALKKEIEKALQLAAPARIVLRAGFLQINGADILFK
jgi:hypothetical protein